MLQMRRTMVHTVLQLAKVRHIDTNTYSGETQHHFIYIILY